jgi:hypothetical protein
MHSVDLVYHIPKYNKLHYAFDVVDHGLNHQFWHW